MGLAASLVVSNAQAEERAPAPSERWKEVSVIQGVAVVQNRRALPRAWLVGTTRAVSSDEALQVIRGLDRVEFDPRAVALVEASGESGPVLEGALPPEHTVRIIEYSAGKVTLETSVSRPAFLVVSENYFPGWEATVDGRPVPVYQTNYLLLGTPVPAGKHRVEMKFHARGAQMGSLISLGTLAAMGALALRHWRRRQVPPGSKDTQ